MESKVSLPPTITPTRQDLALLQKIASIGKSNDEIIERVKTNSTTVIVGYQYTFQTIDSFTVRFRPNIPEKEPFIIKEEKVTKNASLILDAWRPKKTLQEIDDLFNDKLYCTCNNFADIVRLNKDLVKISQKYKLFDGTESALAILRTFLNNMKILQSFLGELEVAFRDAPSQLPELNKQLGGLNKSLRIVLDSVVGLNEAESKRKESEELQSEVERLRKEYPGVSYEEAKELDVKAKSIPSAILKDSTAILKMFPGARLKFQLIHDSTKGKDAASFDRAVKGIAGTLILIKSTANYVFGAYVHDKWGEPGGWVQGSLENFLFTFGNSSTSPVVKLQHNGGANGIHISSCGLHLSQSNDLLAFCGHACGTPTVYNKIAPGYPIVPVDQNLLAGSPSYEPALMEVFSVTRL